MTSPTTGFEEQNPRRVVRIATALAIGACSIVVLILATRGSVAFYKQYTTPQSTKADATTSSTVPLDTKAQRLQRANQLVTGMGKQSTVTDTFIAADGTTGVIVKGPEGSFVGWMVDGVPALWVGAKFNAQGRNITQEEMIARGFATPVDKLPTEAAPTAPTGAGQSAAQGLMQAVNQSAGFMEGTSGPTWTVYIDANCPFCDQLWRNLRNPIAAGQIRVRWVPVAVISATSSAKAATLLQSSEPISLMTQHSINGSPVAQSNATAQTESKIQANNAMLRALNAGKPPATPTLVIPAKGAAPMIVTGIPPNIEDLVRAGL